MFRQRSRAALPWIGVAALLPVLLVASCAGLRQARRAAVLEQQLSDLRQESEARAREEAARLRAARARGQRLGQKLQRSQVRTRQLAQQLDELRSSASSLQGRVELLAETVSSEPPPLALRIEPGRTLERLVAVAENDGPHAVTVIESSGRLWIDGLEEELGGGVREIGLDPGLRSDVLEFPLIEDEPERVASGATALRGALCLAYARGLEEASSAWGRELWFEYQPSRRDVALLREDSWPLAQDEVACDWTRAERPW